MLGRSAVNREAGVMLQTSLRRPRAPSHSTCTNSADAATPYIYHCHLLWHEDQGMMGQFTVVEPGQRATMTEGTRHEH